MINLRIFFKRSVQALVLGTLMTLSISCEKEITDLQVPALPETISPEGMLRDSVFHYTHYFYLWQDQLPNSFATHQYKTADLVLKELKKFAKDEQGNPIDRFSFLDRSGSINQEIQQGLLGDFGFEFRYLNDQDLYVKKVYMGSPAAQIGMERGWKIEEINGVKDLSVNAMEEDDFAFLFNSLYDDQIELKLKKPSGQVVSANLIKAQYNFDPILAHGIYQAGTDAVGYLAFDSFVSKNLIQNRINQIFTQFEAASVKSVVVDLRYNGGGDVATANYLSNLLVPASADQKLMNRYVYNETLENDGWGFFLFFPEFYKKTNALELDRVYFLVTNGTASASELLINNLKPYMEVILIGDGLTYGKPVGYFGWDIMGVDLYAVSFQTINANNEGDYFDGMVPNLVTLDDVSRNFGDSDEEMIAQALYHQEHHAFRPNLQMGGGRGNSNKPKGNISFHEGNAVLSSWKSKAMFDFSKSVAPKSLPVK